MRSCFEEVTPAIKTNKFQRCWTLIKAKHKNILHPLLQWNAILTNKTEQGTSSQNETAQSIPSTNKTEHFASPRNKTG